MQTLLKKIYKEKILNQEESYQLFELIINGKIQHSQLKSILTIMQKRGESKEEIIGAIHACLKNMKNFPTPQCVFSDISGTGGDLKNTINISTTSAFVASFCGFKIIKHCNTGISSTSGSSDLLKKFNINLHASIDKSYDSFHKLNICFLFAPHYHYGFKYAQDVRKSLKIKTIFNLLGPFLNPAKPSFIVMGVYNKKFIAPTIEILKKLNYKRAIVLHGHHTDEVTLSGTTYISELCNKKIFSYEIQPQDFGIKKHVHTLIKKPSKDENFHIIKRIMQGYGEKSYEELIAVNVAVLLKVFGHENLKKNTALALKTIRSGNVYKHIINIANTLKDETICKIQH